MKGAFFALQKSHYCIAKGVLLKSKRGSFAAKTNVFASRFIVIFERNCCNLLISRQLRKTSQNSRIPHQIFPCAFNSQFWAVENANIVWSFTLKLWCWGGVICSTSYRRLWRPRRSLSIWTIHIFCFLYRYLLRLWSGRNNLLLFRFQ